MYTFLWIRSWQCCQLYGGASDHYIFVVMKISVLWYIRSFLYWRNFEYSWTSQAIWRNKSPEFLIAPHSLLSQLQLPTHRVFCPTSKQPPEPWGEKWDGLSFSTQAPPLIASTNAGEPGARIAAWDLSSSLERLRMLSSVSTGYTSNSLSLPLLRGESYIFFSHQMCISFVSAPHLSRNPSACQMMYRKSWFIVGWFGRHRVAAIGLNLGGHNLR